MSAQNESSLASYRQCTARIVATWADFLATRADRLRHGNESEKVAEAILDDLLTQVLDWTKGDLLYQVGRAAGRADIILSQNRFKYLVIEAKRPGSLAPGRRTLEAAVAQARRYADQQRIPTIAVTDGRYLYAADISADGLTDRALVDLACTEPQLDLWYLSVYGVYRPRSTPVLGVPLVINEPAAVPEAQPDCLLHPKHKRPASCFAYVSDANQPKTWKLPYLLADGTIDPKRLPMAIQAVIGSYRGTRVKSIPESSIPNVLLKLARAAESAGLLPPRAVAPAPAYRQLMLVLEQLGLSLDGSQ
jgi:hypothetical protein